MLDMFKRKTDLPEYNYLYAIPGLMFASSLAASHMYGLAGIYTMGYLASSLCCINGIASLSTQGTARFGNASGMVGVFGGIITTMAAMNFPVPVLI